MFDGRLRSLIRTARMHFTAATAVLSPQRTWIVSQHKGRQSLADAKRVVVFVNFDRQSVVHDFVLEHLRGLQSAGFTAIVVVNSPKLTSTGLARLAPLSALVVHRRNHGHDFGGYHDGLRLIPNPSALDGVLLINDSTYGPLFDLQSTVFDRIKAEEADVWSLTDSWQHRYHLQSYFLYATRTALQSDTWARFWRKFRHVDYRDYVIEKYEIGLTQFLVRGGVRCNAVFPYRDLAHDYLSAFRSKELTESDLYSPQQIAALQHIYHSLRNGVPMNGTHFLWDRLLVVYRCPYIKRDLLSHNPTGIPLVGLWESAIREYGTYDTGLIDRHLQAIVRNRSP